MFFACRIHNNSLGTSLKCETLDDAVEIVVSWAKEYVKNNELEELTEKEIQEIKTVCEYYNDDDSDNIVTFSVGMLE